MYSGMIVKSSLFLQLFVVFFYMNKKFQLQSTTVAIGLQMFVQL